MARKRMFRLDVIETDAFMDMSLSTQALYFHLNLRADDDGFVGNPKQITRMVGANEDDLKILLAKRFILAFDDGVIVIKHWRMHNTLSKDRYTETKYIEDKAMLKLKENKAYTFDDDAIEIDDSRLLLSTKRQVGNIIDAQKTNNRRTIDAQKTNADKNSIEENSIENKVLLDKSNKPLSGKPDLADQPYQEIIDYLNQKAGKSFKWKSKKTQEFINARLKEGFSVDDFKKVIDTKTAQWKFDPKMEMYLRPETLFRPGHFESYLNENPNKPVDDQRKRLLGGD